MFFSKTYQKLVEIQEELVKQTNLDLRNNKLLQAIFDELSKKK